MRPCYAKFLNDDYSISIYYYVDKFCQIGHFCSCYAILKCFSGVFLFIFWLLIRTGSYTFSNNKFWILSTNVLSWKVLENTCQIHRCNQVTCQPLQLPDRFESRFLEIFDVRHHVAGHQLRASPRPEPLLHAIQWHQGQTIRWCQHGGSTGHSSGAVSTHSVPAGKGGSLGDDRIGLENSG